MSDSETTQRIFSFLSVKALYFEYGVGLHDVKSAAQPQFFVVA